MLLLTEIKRFVRCVMPIVCYNYAELFIVRRRKKQNPLYGIKSFLKVNYEILRLRFMPDNRRKRENVFSRICVYGRLCCPYKE